MTQTTTSTEYQVTGKDRLSDTWTIATFPTYSAACAWATQRAFLKADDQGRNVRPVTVVTQ